MEGILQTGEEEEAEYTDDSGIRFDIQGALVGKIIKISKSKLSGSWSFTCPHCGRENGIDTRALAADNISGRDRIIFERQRESRRHQLS